MANCCSCSAPLPPKTRKCEYCGSMNDIDLAGIHYHTHHEPEAMRPCPRCDVALKTIDLNLQGRFLIERCDECHGLFFDPNELEALIEAKVSNVFSVNLTQLEELNNSMRSSEYGVSYVKCPICSKIMNRVNYGARSGVIVDCCKDHGVWLDGGELRHLLEWTKAGGKILDQERRERQKKEEELKSETPQGQGYRSPGNWGSDDVETGFGSYGGSWRNEPDLLYLVGRVIRFLVS